MVLPPDPQFTYVVEKFKRMPCEEFSGAPKYAFELEARINISTADQAKEWLSQCLRIQNILTDIQEEERASVKKCCIKHTCIVTIIKNC